MRSLLWTICLVAVAACDRDTGQRLEELPPMTLEPKLPMLKVLAAAAAVPDDARQAELRDLLQTAYLPGSNPRLAMQAERMLIDAGDRAWILAEALEHENVEVRAKLAFELGRCGQTVAIFPLIKRLKYEPSGSVRIWVASALAELGNYSGLPELMLAMEREVTAQDAGLRAMAICAASGKSLAAQPSYQELQGALSELHAGWRATGRVPGHEVNLEADDLQVRASIAAMLVQLQGFELRPVDDARYVLSRSGALTLPLMAHALQAREEYLRVHALEIVSDLGVAAQSLGESVLALLGDPLSRSPAIRALGEMRVRRALPHLLALSFSEDIELKTAVALCLGPLGDRRGLPRLEELFADSGQVLDVRVAAAFSLAIFETDRPAYRYLLERRTKGDYHPPTIEELIERIERIDSRR